MFLADSSGSINDMSPSNFQFMKNFIIQFAGLQELGLYTTQIGMATFSTYGRYVTESRKLLKLKYIFRLYNCENFLNTVHSATMLQIIGGYFHNEAVKSFYLQAAKPSVGH